MATIGNTQQISQETLEAIWLLNANILLFGSDTTVLLQLRVMFQLFGHVDYGKNDREELQFHQKKLLKLIQDTRDA